MSKGKVLVVDDDPITLEVMRERLERAGYDVATRGEALGTSHWIARNRPDFVLLDVNMPALAGNELATLLRQNQRTRDICVILHSSMEADELERLVHATGVAGAIEKTADPKIFVVQFERLISQFRNRQERT